MVGMENSAKRVLFVHAHPDDETLWSGGTIATYAAQGAQVTVLTATRGELGEVIPESLKYLEHDQPEFSAAREAELSQAVRQLGVTDHRWLGGLHAKPADVSLHRYSDSGMQWGPGGVAEPADDSPENALANAPLDQVAEDIQAVIQQVRPHAIVTYNAIGGYGHPDHVMVHRATQRAFDAAHLDDEAWHPSTLFAVQRPRSAVRRDAARTRANSRFEPLPHSRQVTVPDRQIDTSVDVRPFHDQIRRAMQCYRTQLIVEGDYYALSNGTGGPVPGFEYFTEIGGRAYAASPDAQRDLVNGWEPIRSGRSEVYYSPPTGAVMTGRRRIVHSVLTPILLILLGVLVTFITTFSHNAVWRPTGSASPTIPYGLVFSLVALLGVALALRLELAGRWSAAWYAVGVWVTMFVFAASPPTQGVIISGLGVNGYIWLYGGMLAVAVLAVAPLPHRSGSHSS